MAVEIVTFGCRLNIAESEALRRHAEAAGGDIVIVNTCAVTAEATRHARQSIRRLKRERPGAEIVVTGCAAQIEPGRFAAMPEVARVVGNAEKMRPETWTTPATERVSVSDIMAVRETAPQMADAFEGHTRAFVQVQNGCDHRCTFCVIPYGRGPSRSVPMGEVVDSLKRLVDNGYREAVITGVDITSYGADLPGKPTLGLLVKNILRHVPGLARLRLSSIDSVEADDHLLEAIATDARMMPHLHLSLQSGDDLVLKRMKRRHAHADMLKFVETLRRLRPDMVFGADIIAGFPTETEEMFARSYEAVVAYGLTHLHVFPFSPRPGTPAARMPQVAREIVKERAARLRGLGARLLEMHLAGEVGQQRIVLTERGGVGRTEAFTPVKLPGSTVPGQLLPVIIGAHDGRQLVAA
ncbi:threonylcarbamoyladenosine tRNA methylthiotransferase MtaB [Pseudochelatococcus lubricantis]|uniref:Threonylcarbamoyladenosine tRNA methylthiotransferase MtaB n=1 Tax=Pseudochelatococcus lubricantis TaxID=1538102 RepID=A0ABX0UY32_9HYPH|nr:tRNA (N(6)-L-threonylcarbamoyladenosine(37)-C(2))-methylthiotransferase MtaB [Pseudochelatococcus lubricantis]NIJ57298.1 threonylcarbamoyladenosine tRNA methylthiotransferase MtaB [Pseudochelatococcus lubricantis]